MEARNFIVGGAINEEIGLSMDAQFKSACLRYLGFIDLNPFSTSYGCADRSYWHYLDLKAFNVASFQVGQFALTVAGAISKDKAFQQAAHASLNFYSRDIQNKGLVDEYFPHQKSFCATAYTTMSAALSLDISRRQKGVKNAVTEKAILSALKQLALQKQKPESANQALAAYLAHDLAVYNLGLEQEKNPFTIPMLSENTYLSEYGGIDLGYTLKCLDICVLGNLLVEDPHARNFYQTHIQKILTFLQKIAHFGFHPSLSSRGNPHRLVGGLQTLQNEWPTISSWSSAFIKPDFIPELVSAENSDDKYFSFFHLTSLALPYVVTLFPELKSRFKNLSIESVPKKDFEITEAGLSFSTDETGNSLVISKSNGGGLLYTQGHERFIFTGYIFKNSQGTVQVPAGEAHINKAGVNTEIIFSASPLKQKTNFLQSFCGSTLTKFLLFFPIVSSLFRFYIYKKTSQLKTHQPYLKLSIQNGKLFTFQPHWLVDKTEEKPTQGWIFTDGHSTRLYGNPNSFFDSDSNKSHFSF